MSLHGCWTSPRTGSNLYCACSALYPGCAQNFGKASPAEKIITDLYQLNSLKVYVQRRSYLDPTRSILPENKMLEHCSNAFALCTASTVPCMRYPKHTRRRVCAFGYRSQPKHQHYMYYEPTGISLPLADGHCQSLNARTLSNHA